MEIQKLILNIVLNVLSLFIPLFKIRKGKISFVSLESDKLEGDFKLVADELEKTDKYSIHYELFKFEKNLIGYMQYFFECIRQLFVINTSELVILDYNNYVVSNFKRRGVKVLQLWHSSGAIKKFGNLVERDYKISNYDYAIVNCDAFKSIFAKAFDIKEQNVVTTGIPKTDALFDAIRMEQQKKEFINRYSELKGKKVILYAPTFRGRLMTDFKDVYLDIRNVKEALGDEYVILYKLHPLVQSRKLDNVAGVICCNNEELYTLMMVSDILVSDYSALIIDYSVLHKPMIFYVPDFEDYSKEPGISFEYKEVMPGPICYTESEVIQAIKQNEFDQTAIAEFQKVYFPYIDGKSTERVGHLIEKIMRDNI